MDVISALCTVQRTVQLLLQRKAMPDPALGPFMLNDAGDPWWRDYYLCDSKATCESREKVWTLRDGMASGDFEDAHEALMVLRAMRRLQR